MLFLCYPKCSTCQKAKAWLEERSISYDLRDIKQNNPTVEELTAWYQKSGLPLKKFFNTSGLQYKALGLKEKLPAMSEDEQLALLATDGMLVKRRHTAVRPAEQHGRCPPPPSPPRFLPPSATPAGSPQKTSHPAKRHPPGGPVEILLPAPSAHPAVCHQLPLCPTLSALPMTVLHRFPPDQSAFPVPPLDGRSPSPVQQALSQLPPQHGGELPPPPWSPLWRDCRSADGSALPAGGAAAPINSPPAHSPFISANR